MLAIGLVFLGRATARGYCRRQIAYLQNTIIVGAGDVGQLLARKYLAHPEYGINLVGFVDAHPKMLGPGLDHLAVLGTVSDLQNLIRAFDIERVLVAFSNESHTETLAMLRELRKLDVQVDIVPRLFEEVGPSLSVHTVEGFPILSLTRTHLSRSSALLKRSVDVTLSSVALLVLAPLFLAIAIAIKLDSRGPILYRHDRIGRGGRKIDVLKFRTMFIEYCRGARYAGSAADRAFEELLGDSARREEFERSYKLTSDPRVTRVGAFLRRTSLDELPQLVNVLRGELSLVGPRPLVAEEVERYYGGEAETLLSVKPGITGYWQVNGRSELAYVDRVRLDLAYIANWSLELDFRIIVKTFHVIFGRRGAF
jgi:exopolysaccharide biosynthesis polyprenyl glycosylphosphotransferase